MGEFEDYKKFFDDAPLALFRTDLETGRFLMANNFAATLLGCESVEDLLNNRKTSDFYPAVVRNKLIRNLKKTGSLQEEVELNLPDGRQIWVRAHLRINCGGSCVECFLNDITEFVLLREKELGKLKSMSDKIDIRIAALA